MDTLKKSGLIGGLALLLISGSTQSATSINASMSGVSNAPQCFSLAYATGYQGVQGKDYAARGRIRSYEYCSQTVFQPCIDSGRSYCYCNTRHHMCTYGHLQNCNNCC